MSLAAKRELVRQIGTLGVVPVLRASSADEALRAAEAICAGGVNVLEITMTVPDAINVIGALAKRFGTDVIVGAGTVLDAVTARDCINAGAQFVVSPALDLDTIAACRQRDIAVMPGALTPTEIVAAWKAGADVVKVFPCGALGGASYLRSLKAPLPQIELMPTGGVSMATAGDFIKAGAFALGVGSDLVDLAALRSGNAAVLTSRARDYINAVQIARKAG